MDLEGVCFICLKETTSENNNDHDGKNKVRLETICNNMNVNPFSILLNSLRESLMNITDEDESSFLRDNYDLSVMLCVTCSSLANKLFGMMSETEVTRLLTDYQLQEFHKILVASEDESEPYGRWNRFQEKMISDCVNPVETSLMEQLRQGSKEICSEKVKQLLSTTFPRVELYRLESRNEIPCSTDGTDNLDMEAEPAEEPVAETTSPEDADIPTMSPEDTEIPTMPQEHAEIPLGSSSTEKMIFSNNAKLSKLLLKHCKIVNRITKGRSENGYCCTICENYSKSRSRSAIVSHFADVHPEVFFARKKFENVSEQAFKSCCREVLSLTTRKSKVLKLMGSGQEREELLCSICRSISQDSRTLRCHMIMEHYKVLKDDLFRRQQQRVWSSGTFVRKAFQKDTITASFTGSKKGTRGENRSKKRSRNSEPIEISDSDDEDISIPEDEPDSTIPVDSGSGDADTSPSPRSASPQPSASANIPSTSTNIPYTNTTGVPEQSSSVDDSNESEYSRCQFCNAVYEKSVFMEHLARRHPQDFLASATPENISGISFNSFNTFANNIIENRNSYLCKKLKEKVRWRCNSDRGGCGRTFSSKSALSEHKAEECFFRKTSWTCSIDRGGCGKMFSSASLHRKHKNEECIFRNNYLNRRMFECRFSDALGECGRKFVTFRGLYSHQREKCSKVFPNIEIGASEQRHVTMDDVKRLTELISQYNGNTPDNSPASSEFQSDSDSYSSDDQT